MSGIFKLFLCLFHVTFYSFKSMMSGIFKLLLCLFHVTFYSLFRRFCIYITGEHFSLSLSACCTWYFSGFLVFMLCAFLFSGNIWAVFGFFRHFLANAFPYDLYYFFRIILRAFFWTPNLQYFPLWLNYATQWLTALTSF